MLDTLEMTGYRVAVLLDLAADLADARGLRGPCAAPGSLGPCTRRPFGPRCVQCTIAVARDEYAATAHNPGSLAALGEAMTIAWAVADALDAGAPPFAGVAADLHDAARVLRAAALPRLCSNVRAALTRSHRRPPWLTESYSTTSKAEQGRRP